MDRDGEDLGRHVERRGRMKLGEVLDAFAGVADALDQMHRRGEVHRDLEPANLFVCHDGTVEILDSGISRPLDDGGRLTGTGSALGTPAFMAPEQFEGGGSGPATDLYALGAVLYFALTGRRPIEGGSQAEVLANLLLHGPRRADEVEAAVPTHVADALATAMAQDPADRFTSAAQLMGALRGEVKVSPPAPRRAAADPSKKPKRGSPLQWLGFLLAVALVVGVVLIQLSDLRTPGERREAVPEVVPQRGGTLRIGTAVKIPSLDPIRARSTTQERLDHLLFDTLVEVDWSGEVVPSLARTWEVRNRYTEYEFHVRPGVVFHPDSCLPGDGDHELDGEDVLRTLERMFLTVANDPDNIWRMLPPVEGTDAVLSGDAEHLAGLQLTDDSSVRVRFTRPAPSFLYCLAWPEWSVIAAEALDTYGPDDLGFHVVGTGPYRLEAAEVGGAVTLVRHEGAWHRDAAGRPLPYLDRVEVRSFRGALPARTALQEGKVDLILNLSIDAMAEVVDIGEREVMPRPGWEEFQVAGYLDESRRHQLQILVDAGSAHPVADDARIRHAIRLAIQRGEVLGPGLVAASGPLADGMLGYRPTGDADGDPERARALLAEAGYPGGEGLPPLTICGVEGQRDEMEVVAAHLGEVGLTSVVSTVEFETWAVYLDEGGCDLLHANYSCFVIDDDPIEFLRGLASRSRLAERDPAAAALMDSAREMNEPGQRAAVARQLADALVEDSMILFLNQRRPGQPRYTVLASPRVHGLQHPRTGLMNPVPERLRELWIEPNVP